MIDSIEHKELRRFWLRGETKGLNAEHLGKLAGILAALHAARVIEELQLPSFRLHALKGDLQGFWAITVRANWRIVFRFENGNAFDVDLVDYH